MNTESYEYYSAAYGLLNEKEVASFEMDMEAMEEARFISDEELEAMEREHLAFIGQ